MCDLFDENLQPIKLYSCAIKMIFDIGQWHINIFVILYVDVEEEEELRTTTTTNANTAHN